MQINEFWVISAPNMMLRFVSKINKSRELKHKGMLGQLLNISDLIALANRIYGVSIKYSKISNSIHHDSVLPLLVLYPHRCLTGRNLI